jgi:hypothetical protein
MQTFTIDSENNISAFAAAEEAAAATQIPFDSFASETELAELVAGFPTGRLLGLWNSLPGVTPVKSFKSPQAAASRIWKRIQSLGEAQHEAALAKPKAGKKAAGRAQSAKSAPAKGKATKKAAPAKAPKGKNGAKGAETATPRDGSKTAQVVAMLQRKNGATIEEIMRTMGWLRHTVRGFMAGAMKKAGYTVESFKPEGGSRTYRINK